MSWVVVGFCPAYNHITWAIGAPCGDWPTTCAAGRATAVAMGANSRADNSLCVTGAAEQRGGGEKEEKGRKNASRHACAA